MFKRFLSLGLALAACIGTAGAQTLVNGDFSGGFSHSQTGSPALQLDVPTGWTTVKTAAQEGAVNQLYPSDPRGLKDYFNYESPTTFTNMAGFACDSGHGSTKGCSSSFADGLQQTVTGLTAGHTYSISFWTNGLRVQDGAATVTYTGYAGTPLGWDVSFAGVTQQGVRAPTLKFDGTNYTPGPWRQTTLNFVANNSSEVLAFMAQIPPQGNPEWSIVALADVRIADVTPVPEPTVLSLLMAGGIGLMFLFRRKRSHG